LQIIISMISPEEHNFLKRLRQGEGLQQDFKYAVNDSRKIARSLSAFANTEGGTLFIGVKDDGTIKGIRSEEEIYMVEAAATMYCRPELEFTSILWSIQGLEVLELTIEKYTKELVFAPDENDRWKAYLRFEDSNHPVNDIYVQVQKRKKNEKGIQIHMDDHYREFLQMFDRKRILTWKEMVKYSTIYRQKLKKILVDVISVDLVEMKLTKDGFVYRAK